MSRKPLAIVEWTLRSNTPKEVLLLAELAEIMKLMEVEDMKGCMSGHLRVYTHRPIID